MDEFWFSLLSVIQLQRTVAFAFNVSRESRTIGKILVRFTIFEATERKMSFLDRVYSGQKYDRGVHQ